MKKNILIISCHGGGGHMSAAIAIEQYLLDYNVTIIDLIGVSLAHLDPLYQITGKYTGQDLYNMLLQKNYKRLGNITYYLGSLMIKLKKSKLQKAITEEIKKYSPDLVISVVPMINDMIIESCKQLDLGCLVVPTDFDVTTFIKEIPAQLQHNVKICLSFDYPEITNNIYVNKLKNNCLITGFPVRKSFFTHKDKNEIKSRFHIHPNRPLLLLVMGAAGSTAMIEYLQELKKIYTPFHIIICIGRAFFLKPIITTITFPEHITYTIIDHTIDIADMMSIADLCITKPGSVTFAENLYMNIPVLLDCTSPTLLWERLNVTLVQHYMLGDSIYKKSEIVPLVGEYLTNELLRNRTRENIRNLKKPLFGELINPMVKSMIE